MKRFKILWVLLLLVGGYSCNGDDDGDHVTLRERLRTTAQTDPWIITKFIESTEEKTFDFDGFEFTFHNNGSVTTTDGVNNYTGSWSISTTGEDVLEDMRFNISFTSPEEFTELNDDWHILSLDQTKIELTANVAENDPDFLTFERP